MATYTFTATPLTPVHVGTGETLDTSRYILAGDRLVEISLARLTAHLTSEELTEFTRLAQGNDLKRLRDFLRHRADPERDGIATMAISKVFGGRFKEKQYDSRNQLLVHTMTRNHQAGYPYIPGSAIKGALRTALVSCLVEGDDAFRRVPPQDGRKLEERALGFEFRRQLHEDPFRTVKVADADLPADATVVSRFENHHIDPEKKGSQKMEGWYERILSRADGEEPPSFTVEIQVDEARQHRGGRDLVGTRITLDDLREAANRFYSGRFIAEWNRFHRLGHMKTAGALGRAFNANGTLTLPQSPSILLRIGRFSHFESLSVDRLRKGFNIQAKKSISEGNTRNLCVLDGDANAPFGWLLLTPRDGDPAQKVRERPRFAPHKVMIPMVPHAGGGIVPLSSSAPRLDAKELGRRREMKIGDWLKTVKKMNPATYIQWIRQQDSRAKALRDEFHAWQRGE